MWGDIAGVKSGRDEEVHMNHMHELTHTRHYVLSLAIVALTLAACEAPSGPSNAAAVASRASARASGPNGTRDRLVNMMDACDSATFAVGTGDPAGCTRKHGVPFDKFIAQLQRTGTRLCVPCYCSRDVHGTAVLLVLLLAAGMQAHCAGCVSTAVPAQL